MRLIVNNEQKMGNIKTQYIFPPIPDRSADWAAYREGYEPNDPVGYGSTEQEAIDDLLIQECS